MEFKIITDLSVLPQVIETNGEELKAWLSEKLTQYNEIVVTPETIKAAKDDKAKLTKLRAALEERRKEVKRQCMAPYEDFERKYKNNVYSTPERAQQEYNRIVKMEQEIAQFEQSMATEFEKEGTAKNKALRDSINAFIKEYNADKGYDYILTKAGDNFLYANEALDITKEVVDGLNSRYTSPEQK